MSGAKDQRPADQLSYSRQNVWDLLDDAQKAQAMAFAGEYKEFLDAGKTEREVITLSENLLKDAGFRPLKECPGLKPGDKVYTVIRRKALVAAVLGRTALEDGLNLVAAHIDSPRLDLKPQPLYEEDDLVLLKTHYYGGIKKYQWLSVPLALHGIVIRNDGSSVRVVLGEDPGDPVFTVSDLLPHLAKDQMDKKMMDAVPGETLNVLAGGIPCGEMQVKKRFKTAVLELLHRNYGIIEEDLISAELELVPAWPSRDIGLDRSFVGGYGQDDRVCAYTALRACLETSAPERTAVLVLADKEETGSNGNTGMTAAFLANAIAEIASRCLPGYNELNLRRILANSRALSADVNVALDPNYGDVVEKRNTARLGGGLILTKYTGSRGKSSTNDAHAEMVGSIRQLFNRTGIAWQSGEMGKVDQGGGGTVAHFLAVHGMDVLDCGVGLLGMHSPFEVSSKADIYMAFKGYKAFLNEPV
ncbi:MAG: putative M18 family aminopeptidase 1 [Firmicutes bacterium ADurb.Bin456]|nr:MAG: putative M18 family aminopeptidase 1 [Firmicutes bacterium ADurb.Bin456]